MSEAKCPLHDPFRESREESGVKLVRAEGQDVPLLLRLQDVRQACKDWKTFSNDNPKMIVLHSEAHLRDVRQLPIETDPPDHKAYRGLLEPMFRKAQRDESYRQAMREMIEQEVDSALQQGEIEAVRDFALRIQSRSLARLLNMDEAEADQWMKWGTHVFHDSVAGSSSSELDTYLLRKISEAEGAAGDDLFGFLDRAEFQGRRLTTEEKHGYANMIFAAGRDTIIQVVVGIVVYLAENPDALDVLRQDDRHLTTATEEFVRYLSPLTVISRTCTEDTKVMGHEVKAGERIGLCWPSANRDEQFFPDADRVVLDRSPNPHVGFGFGIHICLGQHQARLIVHGLLQAFCEKLGRIELIETVPEIESESSYQRQMGYQRARIRCTPIDASS